MRTESSVEVPVGRDRVAPWVSDLSRYPEWMPLVHEAVQLTPDGDRPAWAVEVRAKVGVFARSKRLRMVRTATGPDHHVFERREVDGRTHAAWRLEVHLRGDSPTTVTMVLEYTGSLWAAGVLDRVLAAQIEAGRAGLLRAVTPN